MIKNFEHQQYLSWNSRFLRDFQWFSRVQTLSTWHSAVAQMVEWRSSDRKVTGSIPDPAINMLCLVPVSRTLNPKLLLMLRHQCVNDKHSWWAGGTLQGTYSNQCLNGWICCLLFWWLMRIKIWSHFVVFFFFFYSICQLATFSAVYNKATINQDGRPNWIKPYVVFFLLQRAHQLSSV